MLNEKSSLPGNSIWNLNGYPYHYFRLHARTCNPIDSGFLDIYWSPSGRYSLHYERRHIDGTVYRHDNASHKKHQHVKTFPKHFRRVGEDRVEGSYLPEDPIEAIEYFLRFTLSLIRAKQRLLYQLTN